MSTATPYTPPKSAIADVVQAYGKLKFFSTDGRIGRLRLMAWSLGFLFLARIVVAGMVGAGAAIGGENLAIGLAVIGMIGMYVVISVFVAQRLHDLNKSGWFCLLIPIPLVNIVFGFYLLFAPGSHETNRYGNPPPPNTIGVMVLGMLMPIAMIGIVAAIAIPAYQGYMQKAKQAQMQTQSPQE